MNWGTGIAITTGGFVVFILALVYMCTQQTVDLVAEDYYQQEIEYQDRIDQLQNVQTQQTKLDLAITEQGVQLSIPTDISESLEKGKVLFFRPSDKTLDKSFELNPDAEGNQVFTMNDFRKGMYRVQVSFTSSGKSYYIEKTLVL